MRLPQVTLAKHLPEMSQSPQAESHGYVQSEAMWTQEYGGSTMVPTIGICPKVVVHAKSLVLSLEQSKALDVIDHFWKYENVGKQLSPTQVLDCDLKYVARRKPLHYMLSLEK